MEAGVGSIGGMEGLAGSLAGEVDRVRRGLWRVHGNRGDWCLLSLVKHNLCMGLGASQCRWPARQKNCSVLSGAESRVNLRVGHVPPTSHLCMAGFVGSTGSVRVR